MNFSKEKIKSLYPEALIIISISSVLVFMTLIIQLLVQWSPTDYQDQVDLVAVTGLTILPGTLLLGILGVYWRIQRTINTYVLPRKTFINQLLHHDYEIRTALDKGEFSKAGVLLKTLLNRLDIPEKEKDMVSLREAFNKYDELRQEQVEELFLKINQCMNRTYFAGYKQ